MQRIERYGVIALVLFLVTIVAVSFWDDGTTLDGLTEPEAKVRLADRETQRPKPGGKMSTNGRALPATSGSSQPRKSTQPNPSASQPSQDSRQQNNLQFETVPGTVANQTPKAPVEEKVVFPESLTAPNPRTQPKQDRSTTNYDTIQQRSQALAQRQAELEANRKAEASRSGAKAPTEAALKTANRSQGSNSNSVNAAGGTYKVEHGDTLSEISFKTLGTSKRWREIQALNGNLDPSQLKVDMVLNLPGGATQVRPAGLSRNNPTATVASTAGDYVVRKGDVLSQIAQDQLGGASRWREIAALNPKVDPNRLMEGAVLQMPGSASPAIASLTTTPRPSSKKNRVR